MNIALRTLAESYTGRLAAIGVASDTDTVRSLRMDVHARPVPRL